MAEEGGVLRIDETGKLVAIVRYFLYIIIIINIGSDRPSLRALYDHVANGGAGKWRDLGVQLLPPEMVDIIAVDHPNDAVSCCKCVLKKWRETATDATWNQLIRALRSPSVQLNYLASQLEQMLITERKN